MSATRSFLKFPVNSWPLILLVAAVATWAGCGGSGGGGTAPPSAPAVSLSNSSVNFGNVNVNATASQAVILTDTGSETLSITSIAASPGANFAIQSNNCGTSVPGGGNCTFSVTFSPNSTTTFNGSVTITDNAGTSPQTISLAGTGKTPVNNQAQLTIDLGPTGLVNDCTNPLLNVPCDVDQAFVTVTVCAPGSTSNCQTIDHVWVDTGSSGLRLIESSLNASLLAALPPETISSNPVGNCASYIDGTFTWGQVVYGDVYIPDSTGETTAGSTNFPSGLPIQVISAPGTAFNNLAPSPCNPPGSNINTVDALGANGLIGVSVFRQDCGQTCVTSSPPQPIYFSCPSSGCTATSAQLTQQLQNPVWAFLQDNNGLSINLASVPTTGAATDTGTITFGIGTESNNSLGSATVFTTDAGGEFETVFNGVTYGQSANPNTDAFIDSGSNSYAILDGPTVGIAVCADDQYYYCPTNPNPGSITATNKGFNGTSGSATAQIYNTDDLFNGPLDAAYSDLGGPLSGTFDFGLPFFFGRTVFVGIEGQSSTGTYWAY